MTRTMRTLHLMIPDPAAFSLMLREGTRTDGVGDIDEDTGLGAVELNTAGAGEVIYNLGSIRTVR